MPHVLFNAIGSAAVVALTPGWESFCEALCLDETVRQGFSTWADTLNKTPQVRVIVRGAGLAEEYAQEAIVFSDAALICDVGGWVEFYQPKGA